MSLFRSTATVGLATLASRLLGFARDVLIARALGAGYVADAFLMAMRLPNLARRVVGDGGLNAGFVPVYAQARREGGDLVARAAAGRIMVLFTLGLLALSALVELGAPWIVLVLAPGYSGDPRRAELAATCMQWVWPFIALASLSALFAAHLNAERRFAAAAWAPVAVNLVLVAAYWVIAHRGTPPEAAALHLAWVMAGVGLVQLAIVGWALWRSPARPLFTGPAPRGAVRRWLRLAVPAMLAGAAPQFILLVTAQACASIPKAVAWLYYADRIFQLPLSLVGVALGIVLLSDLAGDVRAARGLARLDEALGLALAVGWPAAAGLAALAGPIVSILFVRGAFSAADAGSTAAILTALALGLPAALASKVFAAVFFARGDMGPPMRAAIAGLLVAFFSAWTLGLSLGAAPAALGAAFGLWTHAGWLACVLRREGWRPGRRLWTRTAGALAASAAMVAALILLQRLVPDDAASVFWPVRLAWLTGLCTAGLAVYAASALAFGVVRPAEWRAWRDGHA